MPLLSWVSLPSTHIQKSVNQLTSIEVHYGLGTPQSALTHAQITSQLKAFYLTLPFYNLTLTLTKLSTLLLYLRLFPRPTSTHLRIVTLTSIGAVSLAGSWMVFSSVLFCIPVHDFWLSPERGRKGRCLPKAVVWFLNAGLQIGTDAWVVLLPVPVLWRLRVAWRTRVGVLGVFGVGILYLFPLSLYTLWIGGANEIVSA